MIGSPVTPAERVPQLILIGVLVAGLLDATAVLNTAEFGIGLYVAVSGLAAVYLVSAVEVHGRRVRLPRLPFTGAVFCVALLWLVVSLQVWNSKGSILSVLSQTTLRTILLGHFLICATFLAGCTQSDLVRRGLVIYLWIFVAYGLYDFGAQTLSLPRFLDGLRNSRSLAIQQAMGAQGWIRLPRLTSLAAEPSHTLMPLALTFFVAVQLQRWRRIALILVALLFVIGTFSRTLWIAFGVALGLSTLFWLIARFWHAPRGINALLTCAVLLLPIAVLVGPLFVYQPGADLSIVERLDSSRVGLWLFLANPLLGLGFQGWDGFTYQFVGMLTGSTTGLTHVHNGMAVYLASLGISGFAVVYLPLVCVLGTPYLTPAAKGWWIGAYSLSLLGGDYLGLPSTWTVLAIACSGLIQSNR